jgi:hypothetical protein
MVAAKIANLSPGGDTRSDHSANLPNGSISQSEAATKLNVSTRTVAAAKKVLKKGTPETIATCSKSKRGDTRKHRLFYLIRTALICSSLQS